MAQKVKSKLPAKLDFSKEAKEALRVMEKTQESLFLTGRAGTGKSTLLNYFRQNTKKNVAVLAPTGVAAVNVDGQTIHSFCGFTPKTSLKNVKKLPKWDDRVEILKHLDAIIIDEVSMVRADLMDMLDKFLRLNSKDSLLPFGGKQMIFIGDLYQLPPVVVSAEKAAFDQLYESPYFFDAKVFKEFSFKFIELETVYRQTDNKFIALLNAIRNKSADDGHLAELNKRFDPNAEFKDDDFTICLASTNQVADFINEDRLYTLKTPLKTYTGHITGNYDERQIPTDINLKLRVGAQVMLLNNDSAGRWINGTMGKIVEIDKGGKDEYDGIIVELETGETETVFPHTWEMFEYGLSPEKMLKTKTVGRFTQYPLRLAWALTIHKSQGKTFDRVILDLGRGTFAHGQLYVALSRCRTLEGLSLKQPLKKQHILMDWRVVKFITQYQYGLANKSISIDNKVAIILEAIQKRKALQITYLKANDEKSRRVIEPGRVGNMEYNGVGYLGVEGFCRQRGDTRVFRVDRILEIKQLD